MNARIQGPIQIATPEKWAYELRLVDESDGRVLSSGSVGMDVYMAANDFLNSIGDGDAMVKMVRDRLVKFAESHGYTVTNK